MYTMCKESKTKRKMIATKNKYIKKYTPKVYFIKLKTNRTENAFEKSREWKQL